MVVIGRDRVETVGKHPVVLADIAGRGSHLRGSDGAALPDGSLAFGVLDRDLAPGRGALLWRSVTGQVRVIREGATIPNGIAVLADGARVAWTDSPTRTLTMFDLDPVAGLVEPRPFARLPERWGVPDGLCADVDGGVWVAMWGGGCILHVSGEGDIDGVVDVGTPYVTSCAFTADDVLVITTAAVALPDAERRMDRGAGGLWTLSAVAHGTRGARTFRVSARQW
jgi:sugar lactone lactonase YvrE